MSRLKRMPAQDLETLANYTLLPLPLASRTSSTPNYEELLDAQREEQQLPERVHQAVAALPEKKQVVIYRRYLDGNSEKRITCEQLGEELGISSKGVHKREKEAFEQLAVTLQDLPVGGRAA